MRRLEENIRAEAGIILNTSAISHINIVDEARKGALGELRRVLGAGDGGEESGNESDGKLHDVGFDGVRRETKVVGRALE